MAIGKTNRPKPKRRPEQEDSFFGKKSNEEGQDEDMEMMDAEEEEEEENDDAAELNELGDRVSNLFGLEEEAESGELFFCMLSHESKHARCTGSIKLTNAW